MKITITGASGFVGTNLAVYFQDKKLFVNSLSLREDWKDQFNLTTDAIIHLAGIAHDIECKYKSEDYFKINYDLTKELFNKFLQSEIKDFFFFSSVNVIGNVNDLIITEDLLANPQNAFSQSKYKAEQYLLAQQLPVGKRLFVIRPCMIHGPGNKGNLNLLYKVVEKGIPWPLVKFENKRSFLSIDNLSYLVHEMLINKEIVSGIYNFADDQPLSTNQLIVAINKALNHKAKFLPIPKGLIQGIAKCGDVINLPLNSERVKKLTESYVVSNQKIKAILGIDKLPLTAEEGIIKTIQSFKNK
ncbi:NAD-dependent epimerase/dehydratase family protein [Empedobacter falsenii]